MVFAVASGLEVREGARRSSWSHVVQTGKVEDPHGLYFVVRACLGRRDGGRATRNMKGETGSWYAGTRRVTLTSSALHAGGCLPSLG